MKTQYETYGNNSVSTRKYNFITFLPKCLFRQFLRLANLYFLIISLGSFLSFSPKEPLSTSGTLAFVLLVTLVKEAYEDFKRWQSDRKLNNTQTNYFNNQKWNNMYWGDLKTGDLILVRRDEPIPADLVILESSNENGISYVDTKNLDGETNLKEKFVEKNIKDKITTNKDNFLICNDKNDFNRDYNQDYYKKFLSKVICDKPNEFLDTWEGTVIIPNLNNLQAYVNVKNLLLRGSSLKNTDFIVGMVIYSGHFCKIMKNAKDPPLKISNVMKIMNNILISLFIMHFIIVVIFTGLNLSFSLSHKEELKHYIIGFVRNIYFIFKFDFEFYFYYFFKNLIYDI